MARHKRSKKGFIHFIVQYGIHIWAILIIANAALVYTYEVVSHTNNKNTTTPKFLDASQIPTPSDQSSPSDTSPDQNQPSPPVNPSINLTFTVPGIGSGGGVMKPIHLKRSVTVFLYATDVNSLNLTVKPLYTIQGSATFDSDPASPTYTSFVNPAFDLGSDVQDGDYQIAFRTDQSLRTLIKQNPTDLGGEIVRLGKDSTPVEFPPQTILMGDSIPDQGDNVINISDYNAFINCYGAKNTSSFCQGKDYGDFNDDGVVDGVDYNILIRSLGTLVQEGLAVPLLSPTSAPPKRISRLISHATPTIKAKKKITPTPAQTSHAATKSGSSSGMLFFFIFIIFLAGGGFFLYRKKQKVQEVLQALIHLSPTGIPALDALEKKLQKENLPEQAVKKATDKNAKQLQQQSTNVIEKDCYIKKREPDESGTGIWLTLTDDNGAMQAHYAKKEISDGFAKVKGVMKTENGKTFLEISELSAED